MEAKIVELINETEYELLNYPNTNLKYKIKNFIKRILKRGYKVKNPIDWPNGLLADALVDVIESFSSNNGSSENEKIVNGAIRVMDDYLDKWEKNGLKVYNLDDAVAGKAFLRMAELAKKYPVISGERYAKKASIIGSFLDGNGTAKDGTLIYRPGANSFIFADMLGMAVPFYSVKGDFDSASKQLINFINSGMDDRTGLPYHGYNPDTGIKMGLVGWGRAVGWMLMGECEYIKCAQMDASEKSSERYILIKDHYDRLCETVMKYQREDGLFGWTIISSEGHADTSATSMILKSVDTDKYAKEVELGIKAILGKINNGKIEGALSECIDFGMHPQVYGAYPWSLGPGLSLVIKK